MSDVEKSDVSAIVAAFTHEERALARARTERTKPKETS